MDRHDQTHPIPRWHLTTDLAPHQKFSLLETKTAYSSSIRLKRLFSLDEELIFLTASPGFGKVGKRGGNLFRQAFSFISRKDFCS
jgi:hypothetical protein